MTLRQILLLLGTSVLSAVSLLGCYSEAEPLPEVRYFAIADT